MKLTQEEKAERIRDAHKRDLQIKKRIRAKKIEAQDREKILLQQINKLSQILAEKVCDLEENRSGHCDSDFFGEVGRDLLKDHDQAIRKLEEMASKIDEMSFDLQNHEMTLENIFDL